MSGESVQLHKMFDHVVELAQRATVETHVQLLFGAFPFLRYFQEQLLLLSEDFEDGVDFFQK